MPAPDTPSLPPGWGPRAAGPSVTRESARRCDGSAPVRRALGASPYDTIAELYDPWSRSVTEDVGFYVAESRKSGGTVVELGVGTGRIAIPIAEKGKRVIGVDSSREMLATCRRRAEDAGVADLLDLRLGDLRKPPVDEQVPLVICPFRSYLHLARRRRARRGARGRPRCCSSRAGG